MKTLIPFIAIVILAGCGGHDEPKEESNNTIFADTIVSANTDTIINEPKKETKTVYPLVVKTKTVPGDIDTITTAQLSEPIKALAAFYAALGGTLCDGEHCKLTTALGLGKQGSEQHKELIKKYFPNDKVAETVLSQDCYLRPSGASTFSDFEYLTITDLGDTVQVDYNLVIYNRGDAQTTKGPDTYLFKDNVFTKLKRNLWQYAEK